MITRIVSAPCSTTFLSNAVRLFHIAIILSLAGAKGYCQKLQSVVVGTGELD